MVANCEIYNNIPRSTAHNINGGTMIIESGTIINDLFVDNYASYQNAAVTNGPNSTLIVGVKDGSYSGESPTFIGVKYGIYNAGTLKYYDGTFSGGQAALTGTAPAEIEDYHDQQTTSGEEITLGETTAEYYKLSLVPPITITPSTLEETSEPITATITYNSSIVSGQKAGFGATLAEAMANASTSTANSVTITGNGYVYAEAIYSNGVPRIKQLQITNFVD